MSQDFDERTPDLETNTQYKIMLGGYFWAALQIGDLNEKNILDCACGNGYGSFYLSKCGGHIYGVDISKEAIDYCVNRYHSGNIEFLMANAEKLPFRDDFFDAVVSQDTVEHVKNDEQFIIEVKRTLKPGGIFIVFTPNSKVHNKNPDNPYHLREYSLESFGKLLSKHFLLVEFYGRKLSPRLMNTEKVMDEIRKLPFAGLRKVIPGRIRHFVADLLLSLKKEKKLAEISEKNDIIFEKYFKGTPTIIALCRKQKN